MITVLILIGFNNLGIQSSMASPPPYCPYCAVDRSELTLTMFEGTFCNQKSVSEMVAISMEDSNGSKESQLKVLSEAKVIQTNTTSVIYDLKTLQIKKLNPSSIRSLLYFVTCEDGKQIKEEIQITP